MDVEESFPDVKVEWEKRIRIMKMKVVFIFILFSLFCGYLLYLNYLLLSELEKTKIEAAFTYNMLEFAVKTDENTDENVFVEARKNYISNYYYLMSIYPDENVNSLADKMGKCFNERDELLKENKMYEAFNKQKECKKFEGELELTLYNIMKRRGFDEFMYKGVKHID